MLAQVRIDPNELIDTTGIGWEEGVLAAVVFIIAVVVGAIVRGLIRSAVNRWSSSQPGMARFLGRLGGWFIILLGVVAALMILGFQLGPMFLVFGIVIVILFLSARDFLQNFGAGIVIQTEGSFRIGDLVEIGGVLGTIVDITGRTTMIDTYGGQRVRVPNSYVLNNSIVNFSERKAMRSELEIGVEYGTDLGRAKTVILDTLSSVDGVLPDPAAEALVSGFGDSAIGFSVRFWHEPTLQSRYRVTDRVAREIDRRFKREGLVIAFPQLVLWQPRSSGDNS